MALLTIIEYKDTSDVVWFNTDVVWKDSKIAMTITPFSAVELGAGMNGGGLKVVWACLALNDNNLVWDGGIMFPYKSVHVEGVTSGDTIVIEGSNDETNYETLTDRQGGDMSFISDGIREIEENPRQIRPRVSSGTSGSANVTITVSTEEVD